MKTQTFKAIAGIALLTLVCVYYAAARASVVSDLRSKGIEPNKATHSQVQLNN